MADLEHGADAALLAGVASGNAEAFTTLYRRHLPLVVRYCLTQTGDRELAADLAAEVFAAALRAAGRYRRERGSAAAWLLGIARNKLRESHRRRRVESSARRRLGLEPVLLTDADLERVDELAGMEEEMAALLEGLPDGLRDALTGHVMEERPYAELATRMHCSEAVVRQRVSRGLKTLRSQLEDR